MIYSYTYFFFSKVGEIMVDGEALKKGLSGNEIILCDYDNVIQLNENVWMNNLLEEKEYFEPYYDFSKLYNEEGEFDGYLALTRKTYYMDKWLTKEGVEVPPEVSKRFLEIYMNDILFYEKCEFLTMASALRMLMTQDFVTKVVFISSAPIGYEFDPRKKLKIAEYFGEKNLQKIEIEILSGDKKKSDVINEKYSNYTAFIDDRIDNIKDIIENTDSNNKTFLIPIYNYNVDFFNNEKQYIADCYLRGISISAYKNDIVPEE